MDKYGKRWISALWALILAFSSVGMAAFASEAAAVIPVQIRLEGALPQSSETFVVELLPQGDDCPMPGGSEEGRCLLKLTGASSGNIRIPCDQVGVYDYAIQQIPGKDPNCTYDRRVYDLRVFVTRSEFEGLDVSAVVYGPGGEKRDGILFQNVYAYSDTVTITAIKTLDGRIPEDGAFSFRLLDETGTLVFEEENHGTRVTFPSIRYDAAGTYRYYLKEVKGDDDGILYDRTVYTVTVEVTRDTDFHAAVTCERNGKAYTGTPKFSNYTRSAVPKTGDSIGIYAAGLVLSSGALANLLRKRRRQ